MQRSKLIQLLDEYGERHPQEASVATRFSQFVAAQVRCFHRDCVPGHVTGSAWILHPDQRSVLLTHHRKLNRWLQPGGHCDGDGDTAAVALREAEEEGGLPVRLLETSPLDIDIHLIPARGTEPAHEHFDVRYLVQADSEHYQVSEESHDLAWVPLDQLTDYTREESVLRMLRKWLSR